MQKRHPSLTELITVFRRDERRRGLDPETINKRVSAVRSLADYCRPVHVLDCDAETMEDWMHSKTPRKGRDMHPSTICTTISSLQCFYRWAVRKRHIDRDPSLDLVKPVIPKRLPRPAKTAAILRAMEKAEPRERAMLALMCYAGLRCCEVAALTVEQIEGRGQDRKLRIIGKGNKEAVVALHPKAWAALQDYGLPQTGHVFVSNIGARRPVQARYISELVSRLLPPGVTAHQLRHWFGTQVYKAVKGDIYQLMEAMRHEDANTSKLYAQVDPNAVREAIGTLTLDDESDAA